MFYIQTMHTIENTVTGFFLYCLAYLDMILLLYKMLMIIPKQKEKNPVLFDNNFPHDLKLTVKIKDVAVM